MTTEQNTHVIENANELCDECGAPAYVHALFHDGPLSWCGHHATHHWDAINAQATVVIDRRHLIGAEA